jgi:two-component system, NarL family, response regulator NreC
MSIRILLAEDHQITRQGLRSLIEKQADMEVIGEAENGRQAVAKAGELTPDIIIMDVTMPELNGMEATRQIRTNNQRAKIIALSMHSDSLFVTEMLKNGASGYLLKDCAIEDLIRAIRVVIEGQIYLSPAISGIVVDAFLNRTPDADVASSEMLSDREREVLQLMAEGITTKQIALKLHISVKTVETHRRQIMQKLNLHTIAELTKYAIRKGLTSLEM